MKILYSCLSKSWGGMEMFTLTSIRKLLENNFQVELICIKESRLHIEANDLGLIIHPLKISGYLHPFSLIKLVSLLKKNDYNFIHTQASKDLWLIVPAMKIADLDTPLFFTKQMGSFIVKKDFLHTYLYKRVTIAFAISSVIMKNLIEATRLEPEKIKLMFNGVDTNRFDPSKSNRDAVRKEFNFKSDDIVIGMIGRISPGKGHEEFLKAAEIISVNQKNTKFIIVGEASHGEDEYAEKIKAMADRMNISNLIFAGFRNDTPDVLSAMDIFVFPSHAEAFGIALIEAMAMEKPSVCSNSDGVLDISVDGVTNLLFQNKSAEDLAGKLLQLIGNENERIKMGEAARKRVIENFDLDLITAQTIEYYKKYI